MAASLTRFRLPAPALRFKSTKGAGASLPEPSQSRPSPVMPTSTGNTSVPDTRHIQVTEVWPFVKFSATIRVTSWPVWVTPSSTTPWSAHMTARALFSRGIRSAFPRIPAIFIMSSSRIPRLPMGFATEFHRSLAASMAFWSAGRISERSSKIFFISATALCSM